MEGYDQSEAWHSGAKKCQRRHVFNVQLAIRLARRDRGEGERVGERE